MKQNCWEYVKCGREPGGEKIEELGLCPAATDTSANGINSGVNGGRLCWAIAGTFGINQCVEKKLSCLSCAFLKTVRSEEKESDFHLLKPGQSYRATKK